MTRFNKAAFLFLMLYAITVFQKGLASATALAR
jgi:hypothetical protein